MRSALLVLALAVAAPEAVAQLRLPLVLSDGAVLQRDRPIPVWGWAAPGASVSVRLGAEAAATEADAEGRWRVELPPRAAGGPLALTVEAGGERAEAHDLVVGDVWVLSGQSNMEWTVRDARDAEAEIAAAGDPHVRHFKVPRSYAEAPADELAGGAWEAASPETVGDFSAVGYFFARDLREHVDVPIGLLHASWGGSRIEPWMSAEMLGLGPDDVAAVFEQERAARRAAEDALRDRLGGELPREDAGLVGGVARWAAPDLDDREWASVPVPATWEAAGYEGLDGVAWYRTTVDLSASEAEAGVTLGLGAIDDSDITFVNGTEVGRTENAWNEPRVYRVPPSVLREGTNVIAVRVDDVWGGGGIAGAPDLLYLQTADGARRSLMGDWRFRVGAVRFNDEETRNQVPTLLWNRMAYPLTNAPVAGVLWYQGESNANTEAEAAAYGPLFRSMIEGWRGAWGQPDLPFFWVQLAGFRAPPTGPGDTGVWPALRESQSRALALPHTAEALALDVGDAEDIHPRDKQAVGHRLALAARALVYGDDGLVYSGPRYRAHTVEGTRARVAFDHLGGGLMTRGGAPLGGFTVAGADGVWHTAEARIEGECVVVWSDAVPAPVAVRYAWADNPEAATLVNGAGLPAAPFWARPGAD